MYIKQTEDDLFEQIDKAVDHDRSLWSSTTFEDGVIAALDWVLGRSDQAPMDEED